MLQYDNYCVGQKEFLMSRFSLVKALVLVLFFSVVLGGCDGSGGVDSEHDLVPAPETHVTDTNGTDVTPPVITLNGKANMTLEQNAIYTEPGAVAVDAVDGRVPVRISGIVNTATVGHYVVTYSATDRAGNQARAMRHVEVTSRVPVLTALNLECNATTLNIGEKATLTLTGTYSDGSSRSIDTNVDYALPTEHVTLNGNILTAVKDGNVTIRARVVT